MLTVTNNTVSGAAGMAVGSSSSHIILILIMMMIIIILIILCQVRPAWLWDHHQHHLHGATLPTQRRSVVNTLYNKSMSSLLRISRSAARTWGSGRSETRYAVFNQVWLHYIRVI